IDEDLFFELFKGKDELTWEDAINRDLLPQLAQLKKQERVEVVYSVKNRANKKKRRMIKPALSFEQLEEEKMGLRKTAKKKLELLEVLQTLSLADQSISSQKLSKNYQLTSSH